MTALIGTRRAFTGQIIRPGAPLSVEAGTPVTNPPALIIGLRQGEGAPIDTQEGDVIQIGFGIAQDQVETDPIDAAGIISGEVNYTNGALTPGDYIVHARIRRGTYYSQWTASASITITNSSYFAAYYHMRQQ